jgi:hypothetical protein
MVFPALAGLVFATSALPLTSGALTLTTAAGSDPGIGATVRVGVVLEASAANYSATALPGARSEALLSEAIFAGATPGAETVLTLGETPNGANAATCAATLAALVALTSAPGWSGRVALTISTDSSDGLLFVATEAGAGAPVLDTLEGIEGASQSVYP